MGIEYSRGRRKGMRKKAAAQKKAGTWGGPVVVRQIGDPYIPPEMPATRQRAYGETRVIHSQG